MTACDDEIGRLTTTQQPTNKRRVRKTTMATATARWAAARRDTTAMAMAMATCDDDNDDDDNDDDGDSATGDGIRRRWQRRWRRRETTMVADNDGVAGSRRVLATAVDDWSGKPYCVSS